MYQLGDTVPLGVTVKDATGTPTDSSDVALAVLKPDGTTDTVAHGALTHSGTGLYSYNYIPATGGLYVARWTSTTPQAAYEQAFEVTAAFASGGTVGLDEVKAHLNYPSSATADDDELQGFLAAAGDLIGALVDRTGALATWAEQYRPGGPKLVLDHKPVVTLTSVVEYVGNVAYTLAEAATPDLATGAYAYTADKTRGILTRRTGGMPTCWLGPVYVTYTAGGVSPAIVRLATLETIAYWWQNSQQRGTVEGQIVGANDYDNIAPGPSALTLPDSVLSMLTTSVRKTIALA